MILFDIFSIIAAISLVAFVGLSIALAIEVIIYSIKYENKKDHN